MLPVLPVLQAAAAPETLLIVGCKVLPQAWLNCPAFCALNLFVWFRSVFTFSFSDTVAACAIDLVLLLLLMSSTADPPRTMLPSNCRLEALQLIKGDDLDCDCAVRGLADGARTKAARGAWQSIARGNWVVCRRCIALIE